MMKWLLVLWLGLSPLYVSGQDNNDVDALLQALAGITHLQGRFLQSQYGEDDVLLEQSSGQFRLLRPGYFAWEIQSPDSQLIIADPQFIWHHDRDLETVTRRPVGSDAEMTPLQILGGDEVVLRESFQVEHSGSGDFVLTPTRENVGFKQLTLHMQEALITGMDIHDNLDQRVAIVFSDLDSQTPLGSADFSFTPPEGADLFYYDE